jgi:hypothetical protein
MASTQTEKNGKKRMDYKPVDFDIDQIAPDAPAGEWGMSIPRGQCKVQPTKEDHFPMVVVPIRLDKTDEDADEFQKALGTVLSVFLVFGGKNPRGERMNKLRIRQLCELLDVDLDVIPKRIEDPENDLEPFIRAIEGKKFTGWTQLNERRDTGETVTEVRFTEPGKLLGKKGDDDSEEDDTVDDDEDEDEKPAAKKGAAKKAAAKKTSRR